MWFEEAWTPFLGEAETVVYRPTLDVVFTLPDGSEAEHVFVVDSGADISVAPRGLCEQLGLVWQNGVAVILRGIAQAQICEVDARVHDVQIRLADRDIEMVVPMCFAEQNAPYLLGRQGFFDRFDVTFQKSRLITSFSLTCDLPPLPE